MIWVFLNNSFLPFFRGFKGKFAYQKIWLLGKITIYSTRELENFTRGAHSQDLLKIT